MAENIIELIKHQADARPSAPALLGTDLVLNYREIHDCILGVTHTLMRGGIKRKDHVILAADNGPSHVIAMLGIAQAAIAVLLDPWSKSRAIKRVFETTRPVLVIADSSVRKDLLDVAKQNGVDVVGLRHDGEIGIDLSSDISVSCTGLSSGDDIALLSVTSGSTSSPKFVPITHRVERVRLMNLVNALSLKATDAYLNLMPQFHSTGKGLIMATLISGGRAICASRYDLPRFHALIQEYKPTWTSLSASMCRMVLKLDNSRFTSDMRFIRISNEYVTNELVDEVRNKFQVPVVVSYGTSETGLISCTPLSNEPWGSGAVGVPVNCDVSILDKTGVIVPRGNVGEIVVRGPNVMSGYFERSTLNPLETTGFHTGDLGFIDEKGWLHVTSRIKEVINRGGEMIAPAEIEECVLQHNAVEDVCCFAVTSDTYGEEPAIALVLKEAHALNVSDIKRYIHRHLSHTRIPLAIFRLNQIPRTPAGKVKRSRVAEICSERLKANSQ